MTTTKEIPAVYGEFGRTLAFAERTLSAVLREHLARRDTQPEKWYALKLLGGGAALRRDELVATLAGSPTFDVESAEVLLDQLFAEALVEGDTQLRLSPEGESAFADLRTYVTGPTVELLSGFDLRDIETTVRTMQAITARASAATAATAT